jgi:predicted acylesterase/phospholipase RssA
MRRTIAVAVLLCGAVAGNARAAQPPCDDPLPHALNIGVPRTSLSPEAVAQLSKTLADLAGPLYVDPCKPGKSLQINLALGSDYEVLDWIERGSVDGGIVPNLSLWLLNHDGNPLREVRPEAAPQLHILRPLAAAPECRRYTRGRWTPCPAAAAYEALLADLVAGKGAGTRRVMLASHLSSTGFLDPVERAFTLFSRTGRNEEEQEALWEELFRAVHFTIDTDPRRDPFALALQAERTPPRELTVISFRGEEVLAAARASGTGRVYQEHLLLSASAAELFQQEAFVKSPASQPPLLAADFGLLLEKDHSPRPLEIIVQADPSSGGRSYGFTIDESLRLLEQQQRSSGQSDLALVLPGGGVKAAYQSRIVDDLYGRGRLRNTDLPEKPGALQVRSVLGTSGGALLGYFVSQLDEHGPFDLSGILWRPDGQTLEAENVFGVTDMLRYLSIAWTFGVFCLILALVTGTHTSRFYGRSPAPHGAWRWRLMIVLAVFFAVPMLIRVATGGDEIEHVPVIEGIFYSILTVLVMFCDQCLILVSDDTETRSLGGHVALLGSLGAVFVFASFFGVATEALQEPVAFGFAFMTLSVIFLGSPLLMLYASGRLGGLRRHLLDVLGSLAAVLLLCAFGIPGRLPRQIPHILALLALIGLAVFAYWYSHLPKRKPLVATLLTFLMLLSTAVLAWSDGLRPKTWSASWQFITADALEATRLAPFLASTGCLLLVIAATVWVYQRRDYSLRQGEDFSLGLALLVGHSIATGVLLFIATILLPGQVHNVEMTLSFWVALTLIGAALAAVLLALAPRWSVLRRAVGFLTSEHPNGSLLPRRYARMLVVATVSVVWWNAMVAPALYGNSAARNYLQGAVTRFDREFRKAAHQRAAGPRGFIPTAKFVAPTNTLDEHDATRYFLFLTSKSATFGLPRRIPGAEWKVYKTQAARAPKPDCQKVVDPGCAEFVQNVIFSSGSPFPIFAAHRMTIPGEKEKRGLIDGGYSNDIPIDAARTIAARQALVVHSSVPVGREPHVHRPPASRLSLSPGMLIRNAGRLPAFMFERGQQVDRLSRQNLFVVGLAPKLAYGDSWPGLAQFDAHTVEALLKKAEDDLHDRIGFVESWGEPRFRFSQQIAAPDAPPATKADPR